MDRIDISVDCVSKSQHLFEKKKVGPAGLEPATRGL